MKKSKSIAALIFLAVCIFGPSALSQTEKLGEIKYTPPAGWSKIAKENSVEFSIRNATNGYCVITLHGLKESSGAPETDFTREWNNLVVQGLKAQPNPKVQTEVTNGWTRSTGGGGVFAEGSVAIIYLHVYSGFGKTATVLTVFNDVSYARATHKFIYSLEMEAAAGASMPKVARVVSSKGGTFGSMIYSSPEGWSEQRYQDAIVFKPLDLPADEILVVQLMAPLKVSGTLEQALQRSYDEAASMFRGSKMHEAGGAEYSKKEAQKSFNGWDYIRGKGGIQIENGTPYKSELGLELFVLKINDRFERIAIADLRKNCNLSRYYVSDRVTYRNAIESFLYGLRFTDFDGVVMKPGFPKGPGIEGVWQGISMSVGTPSVGEPLGVRYKVFTPIFLSNGQAYFGPRFPSEGLDGPDTRINSELHRRDWGTYTFADGVGVLKMPYGNIPLRMDGDKLIITPNKTDHRFGKLNSVDGATFDGTYVMAVSYEKLPVITFTSAGRFTDNGAVRALSHALIDCVNPALLPGSGTYEVRDFTAHFNYSDGRRVKIAFLGVDYSKDNPSPTSFTMSSNEDTLTRR
jgi:hypothetical protein